MSSPFRVRRSVVFRAVIIPAIVVALFAAGCNGGGSASTPPQFSVTTTSGQLATVVVNSVYPGATLTAANGTAPFTWTVTSGALPTGLMLSSAGALSGTPTQSGAFNFTVTVMDSAGHTATANLTVTITQPPAITSGNSTTFTAGVAGTFTATATGFPAPTFTETGALPTGVTLTSAGVLSGTPGATSGGVYPITITAANGATPNATQSFTLTVNQTPIFNSANSTSFVVSSLGTFPVTASGFPAPTFSTTSALPAGVTLSSTGVLSGTPGTGTQGSYPITIIAANGIGTNATQSFTLAVDLAPTFTSGNSTTFTAGTPGTFTATATGFPVPTFTTTSPLPAGVTLSPTGVLSGTPGASSGMVYPITITAANGIGTNATQSFTLTVNQAPVFNSATSTSFVVGSLGTFPVTASGFPAPTFSTTSTLPAGVTLSSAGVLSGTPGAGTQGSYPITIIAANGIGTNATQNFTLAVDLAPTFTSGNSTTFTAGTPGTFTATATGFPVPTFSTTSALPAGVTLSPAGVLSGTPGATSGMVYPITITATNGVTPNATQSFTLTVNQAPVFTSATSTTFALGSLGTFPVTASGFPAPTFSTASPLPAGVTLSSAGVLSGTPGSGTQGVYPITITAANGIGTNPTQSFTLTVDLGAGFTSSNNATFTVGAPGTFTVTTVGTPTPALTKTAGTLPSGVTFTDNGNGTATLAGTPGANSGAPYSLTFTATNGVGTPATQSFTLTVDQAPGVTSLNNTTFTEGAFTSFMVTTSGFPAPALNDGGATLPSGVSFTDNGNGTATLAGTPAAGSSSASPYSFTITANNGVAPNGTQSFTLTVNTAPSFTSSNSTTFTAGTPGTFTVIASGKPTPTLSKTAGTLPSGVTLTDNGNGTGTLAGTPGAGGLYSFTITAHNGAGADASQSFTLTVDQAPLITSMNSAAFATTTSGSFTVTTLTSAFPTPALNDGGATLPSGVTFTDNGNGTATLAGTPGAGTSGSYPFTITAQNGISPNATQSFTLTVTSGPPTISVLPSGSAPLQAGGGAATFNVTVANDQSGDVLTPTLTVNGAACTPTTCGTLGSVNFVSLGNYTLSYTPPASANLTTATTFTLAVSSSISGSFTGTDLFNVFPSGLLVRITGLNPVQVVGAAAQLNSVATVYNDVGNAGVTFLPLTASGYACPNNGSGNACGTLAIGSTTVSGTTTTTHFTYTPPTTGPANPPYDQPRIQATSVANTTKLASESFTISTTSGLASHTTALTGGTPITESAGFADPSNTKTATWTLTAGGANCQPLCGTLGTPTVTTNGNNITSTITYTPPASVPTGPDVFPTLTATLTANNSLSDSFFFDVIDGTCGTGNNGVLKGQYAFLLRGGSPGNGYNAVIGSFTADGLGGISGGLEDVNRSNGASTGLTINPTGSSYSVGSDNRGCLTLVNSNGGTGTYRIALGTLSASIATQGSIITFGDTTGTGQRAQGAIMQQTTPSAASQINGTYVFRNEGADVDGGRYAAAGLITANGVSALSNLTLDFDDNGSVGNLTGGSGTYTMASNGRGTSTSTVTTSGGAVTSNGVLYEISPSEMLSMSTDPIDSSHPVQSGEVEKQTISSFTGSTLSGNGYVFSASNIDSGNGGNDIVVGQAQITSASGSTANATVTLDENDNGVLNNGGAEQVGSAVLTLGSNGRATITGVGNNPPVFYFVGPSGGFLVGTDTSGATSGHIDVQTGGPFSTGQFSGPYFFGGNTPTTASSYDSGTVNFSGSGTLTGTDDSTGPNGLSTGSISNCGSSATYSFSNTSVPVGKGNLGSGSIGYAISTSRIVFMNSSGDPELFNVQK